MGKSREFVFEDFGFTYCETNSWVTRHLRAPKPEGQVTVSLKFKWRGRSQPPHLMRN